jgi:dihydrolipoamide dehydrogenase
VSLVEVAPRILMSEDEDVAKVISAAMRASGIDVTENAAPIERFERTQSGTCLVQSPDGAEQRLEATIAVVAVGWAAATVELDLDRAGVKTDHRGYVEVDSQLRTTVPHVFAAGDVTGRAMVVHEAVREGFVAATNAVLDAAVPLSAQPSPIGSFTDPEYASVGLSEAAARASHDVVVANVGFDSLPRPIIDGRTVGFCKLIVDRRLERVLGCHIVGERAVELAQLAATAMAAEMRVDQLALVPFSFPTYANALGRAAAVAAVELHGNTWAVDHP